MRSKIVPIGFFAATPLLLGAGCPWRSPEAGPPTASPQQVAQAPPPAPTSAPQPPQEVKEFAMTARQWEFEPAEIRVRQGERVRIAVTSVDVAHGFGLPTFGINERLEPGKTATVEFTADKTGTFAFFCTVFCGRGHSDMRGTLIVE